MQRDHRLCVDCLDRGMITPAEAVHHVIELTPDNINDQSISLNMDNLVSLCRECHEARHKKEEVRRYQIGADGSVIAKF